MQTYNPSQVLLNGTRFDAIPSELARAKRSDHARQLSLSSWLLRRKRDGRFLAALNSEGTLRVLAPLKGEERIALSEFASEVMTRIRPSTVTLPLTGLEARLRSLGLATDHYESRTGLSLVPEPSALTHAGADRYKRPLWLTDSASRAWQQMREAARADGVHLEAISGYRGHDYQLGIFERKRARGQSVEDILRVNAAPGYSEHHSGRALDISSPGEPAAEESFEKTPAFNWLTEHAANFGFRMSYPRDNPHGIVYEPWHWYFAN